MAKVYGQGIWPAQQRGGSIQIAALLKNLLDHPGMILPEWHHTLFWEIARAHEAVSGPVCLGTGSRSTGSRLQAPGLLREGRSSFVERSFSTRARPNLSATN